MRLGLIARAWAEYAYVDWTVVKGFQPIHQLVTRTPVRSGGPWRDADSIVQAVTTAQFLYPRSIRCLERAAVVTRLLRSDGHLAEMLIGYQLPRLRAHAWVEVAGQIVTGYQEGIEHYSILDRW